MVITRSGITAILCVAVAVIFAVCIAARTVSTSASAPARKIPIYSVGTTEKKVCLTFDAAWGNEDTQQLIDILAQYNIKATFFIVGEWVDKYPESVKALSDAGHSIQNHSDTHPHLPQLSREKVIEELENCNDKIEAITGVRPDLIRVPYGDYNNAVVESAESIGMYTIQWDVDSLDWKDLSAQDIHGKVVNKVKEGSIVLFHNAALHTPEALPSIIESLIEKGYKFVTVGELIYRDNYTVDHTGRQQSNTTEPTKDALSNQIEV
ncbi:MAG: polysaccharide deacetylase family protein [Clostridia bacterium]|nr:polysaccharide deacetylase family protein [Clostridia bacterium]